MKVDIKNLNFLKSDKHTCEKGENKNLQLIEKNKAEF